jgi:hypothetical protein
VNEATSIQSKLVPYVERGTREEKGHLYSPRETTTDTSLNIIRNQNIRISHVLVVIVTSQNNTSWSDLETQALVG